MCSVYVCVVKNNHQVLHIQNDKTTFKADLFLFFCLKDSQKNMYDN